VSAQTKPAPDTRQISAIGRKEKATVTSQFLSEAGTLSILDDALNVCSLVAASELKPNKTISLQPDSGGSRRQQSAKAVMRHGLM
ncbi:MAG TPA: hypothetical protein VEK05_10280, partial [Burkholderiales bacterium]|nr:hypothetical protein [Burkholderiales bacterium]